MAQTALSQLQPIAFEKRIGQYRPAPPPENEQLRDGPLRTLAFIVTALMIVMGIWIIHTADSAIWDAAISHDTRIIVGKFLSIAGTIVFLAVLAGLVAKDELGHANFVSLLPTSLWMFMQRQSRAIEELRREADRLDKRLASLKETEAHSDEAERLLRDRKDLDGRLDELFGRLQALQTDDDGRVELLQYFFEIGKRSRPGTGDTENLAAEIHDAIMSAGRELGINEILLARRISYLV